MTISWDWPPRPTLTLEEEFSSHVAAYETAEDKADDRDYRFFLLFVWVGGITYLVLAVLGIWKAVQLVGGLVG